MSEIYNLSLTRTVRNLKEKNFSVSEVVTSCLERIAHCEPEIAALLTVDAENALDRAREMDRQGVDESKPLWGAPLTVKDALSTKNLRTTAASKILEDFIPFYDAFVVKRLKDAGAIILGKTNMDEFAMGSATENSAFQKTRNPWNVRHVPGGSSGGSAASVAACECCASLGSDTGGSIRQPAAFCGCVGLKPTYGRVSRFGLFAFASSLDQVGPIARSVEDCAAVLQVIAGHDPRDNTSSPRAVDDYLTPLRGSETEKPLTGIRIGMPRDFFGSGLSGETTEICLNAIKLAENLGAEIVDISLPDPDIAIAAYYIIAMAEASSNLARYDGVRYGRRAQGIDNLEELYFKSRTEGFGEEVKRRVMLGSFVLSAGYYDAYYRKAAQARRLVQENYLEALKKCDTIFLPVAPGIAWESGAHQESPLEAYLMDAYTLPINLAGLPGISIPAGLGSESGLPVGIQLVGKIFGEAELLRIAHILETHLPKIGAPVL